MTESQSRQVEEIRDTGIRDGKGRDHVEVDSDGIKTGYGKTFSGFQGPPL